MKTLFKSQLTDTHTSDQEGVGSLRYEQHGIYRYVKNAESSTALAVGAACCHAVADGANFRNYVHVPATADLGSLAGIVMATSLAAGSYGWIQVHGYNASVLIINTSGTTITGGCYLKGVNGQTYLAFDAATQPAYLRTVQNIDALATVTTTLIAAAAKKAFIQCI